MDNLNLEALEIWGTDSYYNKENRTILLTGEINETNSNGFIAKVLNLEKEDSQKPIFVHIHSGGGAIFSALAMYDVLRAVSCPIVTFARGLCGSAALTLLAAGDKRVCSENTIFFYHQAQSAWFITCPDELQSNSNMYDMCNEKMMKLCTRKLGFSLFIYPI